MPSISQDEIAKYWEIFQQQNPTNGYLSSQQMMTVLQNSQLPRADLEKVWDLADIDGDGRMDFEEFCIAMRLVFDRLKSPNEAIPTALPAWLVPASKQHLLDAKLALSGQAPPASSQSINIMDDEDLGLRTDFNWYISPSERREYEAIYSVNSDSYGRVSYGALTDLYASLDGVPETDISSAWNLVNPKSEERIDKEQCIVFLHMLNQRHKGVRMPKSVPASLRATFGKDMLNYDVSGPQSEVRRPSGAGLAPSTPKPFAEGYLARLGLGGRSQGYSSQGTDFSATKDTDWEEVRLKRELADLESRLDKIERAKEQRRNGAASTKSVVRRELQLLLEYKESQLSKAKAGSSGSSGGPGADLAGLRDELAMIAEQLDALKEHGRRRQEQLSDLRRELEAL